MTKRELIETLEQMNTIDDSIEVYTENGYLVTGVVHRLEVADLESLIEEKLVLI